MTVALVSAAGVMVLAAVMLQFSGVRDARVEDDQLTDEEALW